MKAKLVPERANNHTEIFSTCQSQKQSSWQNLRGIVFCCSCRVFPDFFGLNKQMLKHISCTISSTEMVSHCCCKGGCHWYVFVWNNKMLEQTPNSWGTSSFCNSLEWVFYCRQLCSSQQKHTCQASISLECFSSQDLCHSTFETMIVAILRTS